MDWLQIAAVVMGAGNLGLLVKLLYNHMAHIQVQLTELRSMFLRHLEDHSQK